ncbi:MAG: tRNA epoxyqueuosine(34) reductase QueG [Tepidisphaera sp.]|nr:tRNA epoxyqueuosine(34) reductase QueG [Tepidisphaera sp.]
MDRREVTDRVLACVRGRGFALAGVAPVRESAWGAELGAWLDAGKHGEMGFMDVDVEVRTEPSRVLDGCRAFVVVGDVYAERGDEGAAKPGEGRVARYAQGRNYHEVMKRRLHACADELRLEFPGAEFRTCVDTVPILEREIAVLAGLGWQAKNTMVIHPKLGSYFVLGVVATTLELVAAGEEDRVADACGTCTKCIEACPTGAITPYSVDGSKCVSYLTIEHRGEISPALRAGMGEWVFGCDVCQEVCPHNSAREEVPAQRHPAYEPRVRGLGLLEVLGWDEGQRRRAFESSAMKRATLAMMKRNAVIAAGNVLRGREDAALLARLREIAGDAGESEMVRQTAAAVVGELGG